MKIGNMADHFELHHIRSAHCLGLLDSCQNQWEKGLSVANVLLRTGVSRQNFFFHKHMFAKYFLLPPLCECKKKFSQQVCNRSLWIKLLNCTVALLKETRFKRMFKLKSQPWIKQDTTVLIKKYRIQNKTKTETWNDLRSKAAV